MNFSEWYNRIIREAEIIDDRYPIKGMPVYKPYGFKMLKLIFKYLEDLLDKEGFEAAWFPVLIPKEIFQKESQHIKGFEEEVFWVLEENEKRLILRPTSETEMYYMYALWIQSYQDLPLKIYMTNTVYRYETKATKPLLRGREILWNEAHTAHASKDDAEAMIKKSIEIYKVLFEKILLIPHLWLVRPDWDKFAGADYTIAADTIMPDGRFLQIGTTHMLGQNFARAFNIKFMDKTPFEKKDNTLYAKTKDGQEVKIKLGGKTEIYINGKKIYEENKILSEKDIIEILEKEGYELDYYKYVWQTSFGVSMRVLGATLSIHGDEKGLILPSKVAPIQIVIVPIYKKETQKKVLEYSKKIYELLAGDYRVYLDLRDDKTPGWKFNYWEFKGVPIRIEIGIKDIENNGVTIAIRTPNEKSKKQFVHVDNLKEYIKEVLEEYDKMLYERAVKNFSDKIVIAKTKEELKRAIESGKVVKAPFCMREECAKKIKEDLHAEVRGYELEPEKAQGLKCVYCDKEAKYWVYIGKTY